MLLFCCLRNVYSIADGSWRLLSIFVEHVGLDLVVLPLLAYILTTW